MPDPTQTVAKIIYDVADAVDGEKDGNVTELNFRAVLDIFDRLDTPNPTGSENIDALNGNGFISTNALGCLICYAVYMPEGKPTAADLGALRKLGNMGEAKTQLMAAIEAEIPEDQLVAEAGIWTYARTTLGFYPADPTPEPATTIRN